MFAARHVQTLPAAYDHGFVQHFLTNVLDNRDLDGTIGVAERCLELGCPWGACLIGGVALEEGLRQLCVEHGIDEPNGQGSLRAPALNEKLSEASVDAVDKVSIAAWAELIEVSKSMDSTTATPDVVAPMLKAIRSWLAAHPAA